MLPHSSGVRILFVSLIYLSGTFSFLVLIGCVALRLCPLFMGRHQKALL